jgi:ABC-type multidrug transport system permease subunit
MMSAFNYLDQHRGIRLFAETYIYNQPRHADFFVTSVLGLFNAAISIGFIFYWQLQNGSLPWWLIALYYFSWVGTGGRMMGAAYALAHKEVSPNSMLSPLISFSSSLTLSLSIPLLTVRVTIALYTKNGFATLWETSSRTS